MDRVFTVDELAKRLRIARSSAYALVRRGDIRSVRVGRLIRIPAEAIDQFLSWQHEEVDRDGGTRDSAAAANEKWKGGHRP